MKIRQQVYESNDHNNLFLKYNLSAFHQRKLSQIKNRKNQFQCIDTGNQNQINNQALNNKNPSNCSNKNKSFFDRSM
jgi:hypothetical protein